MISKKSRHSLDGEIIKLRRGLAIYKTLASPFYFARILDVRTKKYIVRSTKETSRIQARDAAEELATSLLSKQQIIVEHTFGHYADRMLKIAEVDAARGLKGPRYAKDAAFIIHNRNYGLSSHFSGIDVREIKTRDFQLYVQKTLEQNPRISSSTLNSVIATFRNILKVARDDGVIDDIPNTPRQKIRDNPRPFFKFQPLVSSEIDEWEHLKASAKRLAAEKTLVRGVPITEELYDLLLFTVNTFVRPISSELYSLKHKNITVAENPKRLLLSIQDGKTGFRTSNSMPAAVSVYERIKKRYPKHKADDYLFFPKYNNRTTAHRIIDRQFKVVLADVAKTLGPDAVRGHTLYSLRHTAICMRLVLSGGKVNIYNLAKTAGTSVEQIERFYARNLPMSAELARNLQTFDDD